MKLFEDAGKRPTPTTEEITQTILQKIEEQNLQQKMLLDLLAKQAIGYPIVIPTLVNANGDIPVPDGMVAVRASTTQTSPVSLTVNGTMPMAVSAPAGPQQVVAGHVVSVRVQGLNAPNTVALQFLDERAAVLSGMSTAPSVGLTGRLVPQLGWNQYVGTYSVTFAASAAAGTVETVAVPIPTDVQKDALYLVSVNNPSGLATSVTVVFNNGVLFGGSTTVYSEVTSVDVASGAVKSYLVQGWLLGDADAQLSVSNDAAASSSGGTVQFEVTMI